MKRRQNITRDCDNWECELSLVTDKDASIRTFMHYSDPDARGNPITVFGKATPELFYNYSDRIGYEKRYSEGIELASKQKLSPTTARFFEVALAHFHDSADLNLQHILLGCNLSSGYHYLVFGYTYTSKTKTINEM